MIRTQKRPLELMEQFSHVTDFYLNLSLKVSDYGTKRFPTEETTLFTKQFFKTAEFHTHKRLISSNLDY